MTEQFPSIPAWTDFINAPMRAAQTGMSPFGPQGVARLLQAQEATVRDFEQLMHRWCERRQEAMTGMKQIAEEYPGPEEPVVAFSAVNDWVSAEFQRLSRDAVDQHAFAAASIRRLNDAWNGSLETYPSTSGRSPSARSGGTSSRKAKPGKNS